MTDSTVRALQWIAIVSAVLVVIGLILEQVASRTPDDERYRAAHAAFAEGDFAKSEMQFANLFARRPDDLRAARGRANSLIQLGRFKDAEVAMTTVISREPENACNHATRGIARDHLGAFKRAMADYAVAVRGCPVARDGMSWWQRVLRNTQEAPPTVAERLRYLRRQMALPESERVLKVPELDAAQKPYEG